MRDANVAAGICTPHPQTSHAANGSTARLLDLKRLDVIDQVVDALCFL